MQASGDVELLADQVCQSHDGPTADRVRSVDLWLYEEELERSLGEVHGIAQALGARAVYWEFDMDNGWASAFFVCRQYRREEEGDDEWASDYFEEAVVIGPAEPELALLYAPSWNENDHDAACNLFLVARTVAAFARAAGRAWPGRLPLCAGFHDQSSLFRILEVDSGHA